MTRLFDDPPARISHSAHPAHELKLVTTAGAPFRCDGCEEPGDGPRYRCEPCNFDLHTCWACAPDTLEHPLFEGCTFVFLRAPPAPADNRRCGDVRGFVYHCFDRDLDLHPCCATLQERIVHDGRAFELRKEASSRCGVCGDRWRRFWFYRSYFDGEASVKDMARRSWEASYRGRNGDGQIVQACAPIMEGALQRLPGRTRSSGGFERLRKIVDVILGVIIAVIFGNPMAMVAAVAGPGGLLRG